MFRDLRAQRIIVAAVCVLVLAIGWVCRAEAQLVAQGGVFGPGGASLQPPPIETGRPTPFAPPTTAVSALPLGNWLVYPSASAGLIYDTNINQTATAAKSGVGLRLVPSILADNLSGISKTTVYGMADARLYTTNQISSSADATAARLGAIETYSPAPDWTLNGQADFTRQQDLFSTFGISHSVTTINPTGIGLSPTVSPTAYDQFSGTASAQKNFSRAFTVFGGSVVGQVFDNLPTGTPSSNNVVYTGNLRGGLWITPAFYGYVQGAFDKRDFATSTLSSSGFSVLTGLGSDRIGLFSGEIFGGFQQEDFRSSTIGTVSGPAFGANVHYFPLPELTLSLGVTRVIGGSLVARTPTSAAGTGTEVTAILATASYSIAPEWTANLNAGYINTNFVGAARQDNAWTIEPTLTYSVWQNWGVNLDFQHIELSSNAVGQSFTRDVVTIGATYKY